MAQLHSLISSLFFFLFLHDTVHYSLMFTSTCLSDILICGHLRPLIRDIMLRRGTILWKTHYNHRLFVV